MMRNLLIDGDSVRDFPNLAVMKISAYLRCLGQNVDFIKGIPSTQPLEHYDQVWLSCIFPENKDRALDYLSQFPKETKVYFGGSGFFDTPHIRTRLSNAIEHIRPDYDLYDLDYSLGFTSRGCIRNCEWCFVPTKEGLICDHAPVSEFWNRRHRKIILLDNNFQASPKWRENLNYIIDYKLKVNFNQGLDARLVNKEFAELLAASKCYNWKFTTRGAHLAFDTPSMKKPLLRALRIFDNAGMAPKRFVIYVLVGFNTTRKQDFDRIDTIVEAGAVPYIMRYNKTKDEYLKHLARYYNRKYYEWVQRDDYKNGVLKL